MLPLRMSFIKKIMKNISYPHIDVEGLDYCCIVYKEIISFIFLSTIFKFIPVHQLGHFKVY